MVPDPSDPRWRVVLLGKSSVQFASTTASMMFARLRRSIAVDSSPANLQSSIVQAHAFFSKYETAMKDDIARLFG
jgi:hypothetical protein